MSLPCDKEAIFDHVPLACCKMRRNSNGIYFPVSAFIERWQSFNKVSFENLHKFMPHIRKTSTAATNYLDEKRAIQEPFKSPAVYILRLLQPVIVNKISELLCPPLQLIMAAQTFSCSDNLSVPISIWYSYSYHLSVTQFTPKVRRWYVVLNQLSYFETCIWIYLPCLR